jgi:hypothetical protein
MVHMVDAACGDLHEAQFNANGLPQGQDGELYCAVRCILHGQYCDTNQYGSVVLPDAARGSFPFDSTNVKLYYGSDISNWCVGLVQDLSYVFAYEVSNVWRMCVTPFARFILYVCRSITVQLQPTSSLEYDERNRYELHV